MILSAPKDEVINWLKKKCAVRTRVAGNVDPMSVPAFVEEFMARACLAYLGELGIKSDD